MALIINENIFYIEIIFTKNLQYDIQAGTEVKYVHDRRGSFLKVGEFFSRFQQSNRLGHQVIKIPGGIF